MQKMLNFLILCEAVRYQCRSTVQGCQFRFFFSASLKKMAKVDNKSKKGGALAFFFNIVIFIACLFFSLICESGNPVTVSVVGGEFSCPFTPLLLLPEVVLPEVVLRLLPKVVFRLLPEVVLMLLPHVVVMEASSPLLACSRKKKSH